MITRLDTTLGHPRLLVDDRPIAPVTFRSFRPQQRYVAEFAALGVDIVNAQVSGNLCSLGVPYSLYGSAWTAPGTYDFTVVDRQMADLEAWSGGQLVLMMLDLNPPEWWLAAHPGHANPFTDLGEAASSPAWRADAGAYLAAVLAHCEARWGQRIAGYALLGGRTHEWFCHRDATDQPIKVEAAERALGRPWPSRAERESVFAQGQFRDPASPAVDAWRFHNEQVADLLLHFARLAQGVLDHRKVLGAFFGYVLQFGSQQLLFGGHLDCERVFASADLDFFLCPANYHHRRADQVSSFMMPVDSLRRHGKLALLEFDHITPSAVTHVEGQPIPGQDSRLADFDQASGVMGRDACLALAKGQGLWWFDMFGGWFDDDRLRSVVRQAQTAAESLLDQPYRSVAQVAVVVDTTSLLYVDQRGSLAQSLLLRQLDGLGRMGTPYDIVFSGDLLDPDWSADAYRLIYFPNLFAPSAKLRAAVKRLRGADRTLLWAYAPGFVAEDGLSVEAMAELTGLHFAQVPAVRSVRVGEHDYGFAADQQPGFVAVTTADLDVLGRTPDGHAGLVEGRLGDSRVAWSAVGPVPGWLLREIAQRAGAHIYCDDDHPLYASNQVLGLHSPTALTRRVWLPERRSLRPLLSTRAAGRAGLLTAQRDGGTGRWYVDVPLEAHEARLLAWEAER
ncbi:MAG: hypothetical protein HZB16_16660 [Armatimonadetes bacterium]|nr:hypothetical protein [Armatimonadota bacterium]